MGWPKVLKERLSTKNSTPSKTNTKKKKERNEGEINLLETKTKRIYHQEVLSMRKFKRRNQAEMKEPYKATESSQRKKEHQ